MVSLSIVRYPRSIQQLRTTVLDGLAHAFKTPLTAISTASSGLMEMGEMKPAQADLPALIDEQAGYRFCEAH